MVFNFKNIGIVESASIELKGVTVLTGLNDTGKSFLGKAIFSILKTIQEARKFYITEKYVSVVNSFNQIQQAHRQIIPFTTEKIQKFNTAAITQKSLAFYNNIQPNLEADLINETSLYIDSVIADIEPLKLGTRAKSVDDSIKRIHAIKRDIILSISEKLSDEEKYIYYFNRKIIAGVFQNQINSLFAQSALEIEVVDGVSRLLTIVIEDNITKVFKVENQFFLNDATIIETPTIIQFQDFITNTLAYSNVFLNNPDRSDLPLHYLDLVQKIRIGTPSVNPDFAAINAKVKELISGEFKITKEQGLSYHKTKGNLTGVIKPNNIATGIKSLGLFQLLLNNNVITKNSLLIFDEPEVHLHPDWEIKYAEIFILLAQLGIPIILSTHSPYFIRALKKYRDKYGINDIISFYYGVKDPATISTSFDDVTNDLEPIFNALAKPMQDLTW
jgi:energy-coupling factor transporter ATP-binding protein EcfA2